jgi:hypothetical protein
MKTSYNTERKKVRGGSAGLTIDSALYSFNQDFTFREAYERIADPVSGNDIQTPGSFGGHLDAEMIYGVDNPVNWMTLDAGGELPDKAVSIALQDAELSPTTKTGTIAAAKFFSWGLTKRRRNLVRMQLGGDWVTPSTWA